MGTDWSCRMADGVAVAHAGWIALMVFGGVAVVGGRFARRWPLPAWQLAYLLAAVGGSLSAVIHGDCALTTLENWLRGPDGYAGSFVGHYAPGVPAAVADAAFVGLSLAAVGGAVLAVRRWRVSG
jgi:hypothetical protein